MPPRSKTSGPAAAPTGEPGGLYFQPTKNTGETEEAYRVRLEAINKEAKEYPAPKQNTPGSFTLLTQYDKNGPTGETRFDDESATLQKKSDDIKKTISRYKEIIKRADADDKKIYRGLIKQEEGKLREIEDALDMFLVAGGDHYMTGKKDASFATTPREIKDGRLNRALEQVAKAKGEAVGTEIRRKNRIEWEERDKIRQEYSELRSKAKELLKGKLPQEVKNDLYATLAALEDIENWYKDTNAATVDLPDENEIKKMITSLRSVIDGSALHETESVLEKTPGEALADIAATGEDITVETLMSHGLTKKEDAENLIALLKREGDILKDNS